jgi:3'(2'), 5'-bisphosphate nucleotidase
VSDDAALSRTIAREAGALLLDIRRSFGDLDPADRALAKELRDTADREAHEHIARRLADERPDDAVLSEEGDDADLARLDAERVWIVDPLDGTWEYGQGRDDFAVHVALWTRAGGVLSAGTVDLPSQGVTWSVTDDAPPPASLPTHRALRVVVSRSRRPVLLDEVLARVVTRLEGDGVPAPEFEVLEVGSVGAKVGELLAGHAELYLHDSGFSDWDLAAPLAVALHRGFWCASPLGGGFTFNGVDLVQPGVAMAAPSIASAVAAAYRDV